MCSYNKNFNTLLRAGSESEEFDGSGKVACPLSLQTLSGFILTPLLFVSLSSSVHCCLM